MFDPLDVAFTPPAVAPIQGIDAPIAPPPVPPAMAFKPTKPNKDQWDVSIVRRAQGIYPAEANAKAEQMQTAKMPTPTGAWGAPG